VEIGMVTAVGDAIVEAASGIEAVVMSAGGGDSGETPPDEQADRTRVQNRAVLMILVIFA
jgi:hypothetical protein